MENQSVLVGAPGLSRPTTSSSMAAMRQDRDQQLEPVLPREVSDPIHELKVLHVLADRLLPE